MKNTPASTLAHDAVLPALASGACYLDVRTPEEFHAGHVPGARNIPWAFGTLAGLDKNPDFASQVGAAFDLEQPLVLGCHSGGRASQAAALLTQHGYRHISLHLDGWGGRRDSFGRRSTGWPEAGYPSESSVEAEREPNPTVRLC